MVESQATVDNDGDALQLASERARENNCRFTDTVQKTTAATCQVRSVLQSVCAAPFVSQELW